MTFEFLVPPCRALRQTLPPKAYADALLLTGDAATQLGTGQESAVPKTLIHSLARRIRAYAGGDGCAAALETPGPVHWAAFAPPLVPAAVVLRLPATRSRPAPASPRVFLGRARAPGVSPQSGLSLLISDRAGPGNGYTLRCLAHTPALLATALEVGRQVADATFLEASCLIDWPLLCRHHRVEIYTACTTLDHVLVALAPPEQHSSLRALLSTG